MKEIELGSQMNGLRESGEGERLTERDWKPGKVLVRQLLRQEANCREPNGPVLLPNQSTTGSLDNYNWQNGLARD